MTKTQIKKNTRIKMPLPRFEKVYKDQNINDLKYNGGDLAYIEADNTLVYQFTDGDKVVFKNFKDYSVANASYACNELLIYFDKVLFNISNYIQL